MVVFLCPRLIKLFRTFKKLNLSPSHVHLFLHVFPRGTFTSSVLVARYTFPADEIAEYHHLCWHPLLEWATLNLLANATLVNSGVASVDTVDCGGLDATSCRAPGGRLRWFYLQGTREPYYASVVCFVAEGAIFVFSRIVDRILPLLVQHFAPCSRYTRNIILYNKEMSPFVIARRASVCAKFSPISLSFTVMCGLRQHLRRGHFCERR